MVQKIEIGDPRIGKLTKENEMNCPKVEKLKLWEIGERDRDGTSKKINEVETRDRKVGELVKKTEMNVPKIENW